MKYSLKSIAKLLFRAIGSSESSRPCVIFAAIALLTVASAAYAEVPETVIPTDASGGATAIELYDNAVKGTQAIGALGPDIFGEQVNLSNGATSFAATDVSLPTNSQLSLSIGRRLAMNSWHMGSSGAPVDPRAQIFGQYWELDVPSMYGSFVATVGWKTNGSSRCSSTGGTFWPPAAYGIGSWRFQV